MHKLDNKLLIENIYTNIVKTSRNKSFFLDLKVEDTVEGRFDIITLHSFIIFNYFISIEKSKSELPQLLFDYMFSDFDSNLREMGFGDIAVNKRMKQFIKAFYGRIDNYSKSLVQLVDFNDYRMLNETILRNIYKDKSIEEKCIIFWREYIVDSISYFNSNTLDENINNLFAFTDLKI